EKMTTFTRPQVDPQWATSRETHMAVATAIHAITDRTRTPEAIWEAPTATEWDHVAMAVSEYVTAGDFEPEANDRYQWGQEAISLSHVYTVDAGNAYFWQRLAVQARSAAEAAEMFRAYLAAEPQQKSEEYEFGSACHVWTDDWIEAPRPERSEYAYMFDDATVDRAEIEDAVRYRGAGVDMIAS